jgi:hypothetical protein
MFIRQIPLSVAGTHQFRAALVKAKMRSRTQRAMRNGRAMIHENVNAPSQCFVAWYRAHAIAIAKRPLVLPTRRGVIVKKQSPHGRDAKLIARARPVGSKTREPTQAFCMAQISGFMKRSPTSAARIAKSRL